MNSTLASLESQELGSGCTHHTSPVAAIPSFTGLNLPSRSHCPSVSFSSGASGRDQDPLLPRPGLEGVAGADTVCPFASLSLLPSIVGRVRIISESRDYNLDRGIRDSGFLFGWGSESAEIQDEVEIYDEVGVNRDKDAPQKECFERKNWGSVR